MNAKTIQQLEDELKTIDAVITREKQDEARGSTRFSRLPGLYAERDRLAAAIQMAREPQDAALALAKEIVNLRTHDPIVLARFLRSRPSNNAPHIELAATCRQVITDHWKPTSQKAGEAKFNLLEKLDSVLLQRINQEGADHE